jgi:hypothetical protein
MYKAILGAISVEAIKLGTKSDKKFLISTDKKSWFDATEACQVQGGMLFVVGGAEENGVLERATVDFGSEEFWIGGSDIINANQWEWSDNSAWSYENWAPNQPDDYSKAKNCL